MGGVKLTWWFVVAVQGDGEDWRGREKDRFGLEISGV